MLSCRCVGVRFFPARFAVPRNPAAPAATAMQVSSPTARHAEFFAPELAAVERLQDRLHLAAEMRFNPHTAPFQSAQQRLGQRRAEQHIHAQFRHAPRQPFRRQRMENEFATRHFLSVPASDQKQPRRCVEHRRDAFLRDGNGDRHSSQSAIIVPRAKTGESGAGVPAKRGVPPRRNKEAWRFATTNFIREIEGLEARKKIAQAKRFGERRPGLIFKKISSPGSATEIFSHKLAPAESDGCNSLIVSPARIPKS